MTPPEDAAATSSSFWPIPSPRRSPAPGRARARRGREGAGCECRMVRSVRLGFDPVDGGTITTRRLGLSIRSRDRRPRRLPMPLPPDVRAEADKIVAADVIMFHFPLWWFAPPAILKGWLDRCLVHGALHDDGITASTPGACGASARCSACRPGRMRRNADRAERKGTRVCLLWPLAYTLRYCGMDVLPTRCSSTGCTAT
jgi:NAD(P)H dehydrogenase (quinone)